MIPKKITISAAPSIEFQVAKVEIELEIDSNLTPKELDAKITTWGKYCKDKATLMAMEMAKSKVSKASEVKTRNTPKAQTKKEGMAYNKNGDPAKSKDGTHLTTQEINALRDAKAGMYYKLTYAEIEDIIGVKKANTAPAKENDDELDRAYDELTGNTDPDNDGLPWDIEF